MKRRDLLRTGIVWLGVAVLEGLKITKGAQAERESDKPYKIFLPHMARPNTNNVCYLQKVIDIFGNSLIGYWPCNELSGQIAYDYSGNGHYADFGKVVGGEYGIGDGYTSAYFNGLTSYLWIGKDYRFRNEFNGQSGAIHLWARVSDLSQWSDHLSRKLVFIKADDHNYLSVERYGLMNNQLAVNYMAGGVLKSIPFNVSPTADNFMLDVSWSKANDAVDVYYNKSKITTKNDLGTWVGTPDPLSCSVGTDILDNGIPWWGNIMHVAFSNKPLSQQMVTDLWQPQTAQYKTVVWIGGSITKGYDASLSANCFVKITGNYLNEDGPYVVRNYNKGVGATGSEYGLMRLQSDVIVYKPDFVVMDWAVNDVDVSRDNKSEEAMIRRIHTSLPNCKFAGIFFLEVNDLHGTDTTNTREAIKTRLKTLYDHYNIPYADYAGYVQSEVAAGRNKLSDFFCDDNIHPSDYGHSCASNLLRTVFKTAGLWIPDLTLYKSLYSSEYENTPIIRNANNNDGLTGIWTDNGTSMVSSDATATIIWIGTFQALMLDTAVGSGQGTIAWSIDGGAFTNINLANIYNHQPIWDGKRGSHIITFKIISGTVTINRFLAV